MSIDQVLERLRAFLFFLSNFSIFVCAFLLYKETGRKLLVPLIVSSAVTGFDVLFPWFLLAANSTLSREFEWYVQTVLGFIEPFLWVFSLFLVLRELSRLWAQTDNSKSDSGNQSPSEESK